MRTLWLAAAVAFVMTACGDDAAIRLTEADAGSTVRLASGGTIEVVLAGNPTTGFTWEAADLNASVLRQVGEPDYVSDSDLPGSPGVFTFTFECVADEPTTLTLVYHRPWEDAAPLQTFTVDVEPD
jgi:inhibitor of cysteine peptidase